MKASKQKKKSKTKQQIIVTSGNENAFKIIRYNIYIIYSFCQGEL